MSKTAIEWAEEVWNPVTGCSKVSPGCANCYAERLALRKLQSYETGLRWTKANAKENVLLHPERLEIPLRANRPRTYFVNSMSDLFHEEIPDEFIDQVFATTVLASEHVFQVLTKRAERMRDYFACEYRFALIEGTAQKLYHERTGEDPSMWLAVHELKNVWLGVSVEDQKRADERIPLLLQTQAAVRFVSAEPLLGPIEFRQAWVDYLEGWYTETESGHDCDGTEEVCAIRCPVPIPAQVKSHELDWVIVGGESGPGARPMPPAWPRSIRDQCIEAGVPFFFKQWGEWQFKETPSSFADKYAALKEAGSKIIVDGGYFHKTGKKKAGRELDGRMWDEMPRRIVNGRVNGDEEWGSI